MSTRGEEHPVTSWQLGHHPALDGVRGLAFLMVLIGHSGWPVAGNRAHEFGVELFFVLSGFLITSIILDEYDRTGGLSLRRFFVRRARRLLPALYALLAVLGVASLVVDGDLRPTPAGLLGALTYSTNMLERRGADLGNLAHLWSLAVEEQFYLLWPTIMLLVARGTRRRVAWTLVAGLALSIGSLAWRCHLIANGVGDGFRPMYTSLEIRCLAPLVGACIACMFRLWHRVLLDRRLSVVAVAGTATLAWLSSGPSLTDLPIYWISALPIAAVCAGTICITAVREESAIARVLTVQPLRWLGRISYAGYLWHYPIFLFVGGTLTQMSTRETAIGVAVTLVVAGASTTFLEERWRRGSVAVTEQPHIRP